MCRIFNFTGKVKNITFKTVKNRVRPTELYNFVGDFTKFQSATNWRPEISLKRQCCLF